MAVNSLVVNPFNKPVKYSLLIDGLSRTTIPRGPHAGCTLASMSYWYTRLWPNSTSESGNTSDLSGKITDLSGNYRRWNTKLHYLLINLSSRMPLPTALQARLQRRGLIKEEGRWLEWSYILSSWSYQILTCYQVSPNLLLSQNFYNAIYPLKQSLLRTKNC